MSKDLREGGMVASQAAQDRQNGVAVSATRSRGQRSLIRRFCAKAPTGHQLSNIRSGWFWTQEQLTDAMQMISGTGYPSLRTVQAIEQGTQQVTPMYWLIFRIVAGDVELKTPARIYKMSNPEPVRHRLTTSIEDYQWMRENGYKSVGDLVATLRETISRDMSILQSQLEAQV